MWAVSRTPLAITAWWGTEIGIGSLSHLAIEAIAIVSGTTIVHIPFPGSPQVMTALIRGDVQIACLPAAAVASQMSTAGRR